MHREDSFLNKLFVAPYPSPFEASEGQQVGIQFNEVIGILGCRPVTGPLEEGPAVPGHFRLVLARQDCIQTGLFGRQVGQSLPALGPRGQLLVGPGQTGPFDGDTPVAQYCIQAAYLPGQTACFQSLGAEDFRQQGQVGTFFLGGLLEGQAGRFFEQETGLQFRQNPKSGFYLSLQGKSPEYPGIEGMNGADRSRYQLIPGLFPAGVLPGQGGKGPVDPFPHFPSRFFGEGYGHYLSGSKPPLGEEAEVATCQHRGLAGAGPGVHRQVYSDCRSGQLFTVQFHRFYPPFTCRRYLS